jgi:hypothetical protein
MTVVVELEDDMGMMKVDMEGNMYGEMKDFGSIEMNDNKLVVTMKDAQRLAVAFSALTVAALY